MTFLELTYWGSCGEAKQKMSQRIPEQFLNILLVALCSG